MVQYMQAYWRNIRFWHWLGIAGTVIWISFVSLTTAFDPAHPLFDFIFLVPIVGWILIGVRIRDIRRRSAGRR